MCIFRECVYGISILLTIFSFPIYGDLTRASFSTLYLYSHLYRITSSSSYYGQVSWCLARLPVASQAVCPENPSYHSQDS